MSAITPNPGVPVTDIEDVSNGTATASPAITSDTAKMEVKYVPTPGAADDV